MVSLKHARLAIQTFTLVYKLLCLLNGSIIRWKLNYIICTYAISQALCKILQNHDYLWPDMWLFTIEYDLQHYRPGHINNWGIPCILACSLMLQMRYLCLRLLHIIICFCWNHSLMKSPRNVRYSLLPRKGCVVIIKCSEVVFKFFLIFAKWISTINLPYPPGMCNAPHLGVKFNQINSSAKMKHSCCYICKINFNVFFKFQINFSFHVALLKICI